MVKEVGIITFINCPMRVQEPYMLVQQFPMFKGRLQGAQKLLLPAAELQGILWVHGGKIHVQHGKCLTVNDHGPLLKVNVGQQDPVIHLILRMALNHGALHLKLNHGNGLVHLGSQPRIHRIVNVLVQNLGHEPRAGVFLVYLGRKHGERPQIDAVTVLQHIEAVVADGNAQHIADTGQIPCGRPHPRDVMIPPLYVHIVEAHELIHDNVRPGAPVIDVAYDVQVVNGQVLNQMAQGNDELVRRVIFNDGVYDFIIVQFLVIVVVVHMKQFVNDVGKFLGHLLAHLGTSVLGGHLLAALYQAVDGDFLPVLGVMPLFHHTGQTPIRIINQVGQLYLLLLRNQVAEGLSDLLPGNTR